MLVFQRSICIKQYRAWTTDDAEAKAYNQYTGAKIKPIIYNKNLKDEDLPF